jgi:ADP-ribose pyrophosphatase
MPKRIGPWTRLHSREVYKNPFIRIQEDTVLRPDGKRGVYAFLKKSPGIFVVPFSGKEVYLVRQFRYVLQKHLVEFPGGVIQGKNLVANAKRELFEETGIRAKRWTRLGKLFHAAGHETTYIIAYLAEDLDVSKLRTSSQEGDESIQKIVCMTIPQIKRAVHKGQIECALTLATLSYFMAYFSATRKKDL